MGTSVREIGDDGRRLVIREPLPSRFSLHPSHRTRPPRAVLVVIVDSLVIVATRALTRKKIGSAGWIAVENRGDGKLVQRVHELALDSGAVFTLLLVMGRERLVPQSAVRRRDELVRFG